MTVKTIFKALIGTVLVLVISQLFVEYINVTITGNNINHTLRTSVEKACDYFGQETYKTRRTNEIGNFEDIYNPNNGLTAAFGSFYVGGTPESIYANLYGGGGSPTAEFADFLSSYGHNWENAKAFADSSDDYHQYFRDNLITPLNMGITYLDSETVERIAQWNMARILTNGLNDTVRQDARGVYVMHSGFRVYINTLRITNIDYEVVDLTSSDFEELTNIDGNVLAANMGSTAQERRNVCIAGVEFSVDIAYTGITQLSALIELAYNTNLGDDGSGTNGTRVQGDGSAGIDNMYNHGVQDLGTFQSGGLYGDSGVGGAKATSGRLVYYVIR